MMHPAQAAAFKTALKMLRKHCAQWEHGFRGRKEIAAFMNQMGFRDGHGEPISDRTLRAWIASKGFPTLVMGKRQGNFTTNIMIYAWAMSYKEKQKHQPKNLRRNRQPKLAPFTQDAGDVDEE